MTVLLLSPAGQTHLGPKNIGNYSMTGNQYETEAAGEPVWTITIWEPSGSHSAQANHYSVYEGELFKFTGIRFVDTSIPVTDIVPLRRKPF